jgi:Skp family chaperone for outer membrane proteins
MRRAERVVVYGGLALALSVGVLDRLPAPHASASPSPAAASPARRAENGKIAVCDIYYIADRLIDSDRYQPRLKEEQERLRAELKPLEDELNRMRERGATMDPQAEETRALAVEFQRKNQEYQQKLRESERAYQAFLGSLYVEAYDSAKASAQNVAEDLGYTYVIASRGADRKIETNDLPQVVQAVLARPVIKAPEDADITEDVIKDLKLE